MLSYCSSRAWRACLGKRLCSRPHTATRMIVIRIPIPTTTTNATWLHTSDLDPVRSPTARTPWCWEPQRHALVTVLGAVESMRHLMSLEKHTFFHASTAAAMLLRKLGKAAGVNFSVPWMLRHTLARLRLIVEHGLGLHVRASML